MLRSVLCRPSVRHVFRRATAHAAAPFSSSTPSSTSPSPEEEVNNECGAYPGGTVPFVHDLSFAEPSEDDVFPALRIMGEDGKIVEGAEEPDVSRNDCLDMYRYMCRLEIMDGILYDAQRQGRISFYMTTTGEEAAQIGSAAALRSNDMVFAQYRECGVLMQRGFTLQQFADQCFSNADDVGKGRQMPIHYGSRALNFQTISSPLATQLPQAAGAAYACKMAEEDRCVVCYFGEGAASEGDFHAAMNFAATLDAPVLFFCRNNGYAISTPVADQFRGDGIVVRGPAYGMASIRVDGNDVFAVHAATKAARKMSVEGSKPVLIEAMTYRVGHHSTSDDSTRYRSTEEIRSWMFGGQNPVVRLNRYLTHKGWWDEARDNELKDNERRNVMTALLAAEQKEAPTVDGLFTDVYHELPPHLEEQQRDMYAHLEKYPPSPHH